MFDLFELSQLVIQLCIINFIHKTINWAKQYVYVPIYPVNVLYVIYSIILKKLKTPW